LTWATLLDCTPERVQGRRLFISTTNGTRALQVQDAQQYWQLPSSTSVVEYPAQQPETVWIVGSGWEGSFSLEDTARVPVRSPAF